MMADVRVRLRRSGGLAGGRLDTVVHTSRLPPDQAVRLRALLTALPPKGTDGLPLPPPIPDSTSYELTVDRVGGSKTYRYHDGNLPARIRPLIEFLVSTSGRLGPI